MCKLIEKNWLSHLKLTFILILRIYCDAYASHFIEAKSIWLDWTNKTSRICRINNRRKLACTGDIFITEMFEVFYITRNLIAELWTCWKPAIKTNDFIERAYVCYWKPATKCDVKLIFPHNDKQKCTTSTLLKINWIKTLYMANTYLHNTNDAWLR